MTTDVLDVVDEGQLEAAPLVGGRVEVVVKSRTGKRQVALQLSREAAAALLADLERAVDLAETAEAS